MDAACSLGALGDAQERPEQVTVSGMQGLAAERLSRRTRVRAQPDSTAPVIPPPPLQLCPAPRERNHCPPSCPSLPPSAASLQSPRGQPGVFPATAQCAEQCLWELPSREWGTTLRAGSVTGIRGSSLRDTEAFLATAVPQSKGKWRRCSSWLLTA